jgi:hypothetical protein
MIKRLAAAILASILGANALTMLAAGRWWYGAVPGVTATGPYNPHFVKDIGAAYLVAAGALVWRAVRPSAAAGGAIAAAGFLVLHAAIHVADALSGTNPLGEASRDFAGVFLPAILAAWIAFPSRTTTP